MKTCIVGSRDLEINGALAMHVLDVLDEQRGPILLRKPLRRAARPFESLVASIAVTLGYPVIWCAPEPGGRALVFLRDVEMVAAADQVIALFPEGSEMTGGTSHVVEKALDQKRPVLAYAWDGERLRLVGSEDESSPT